MPRKRAAPGWSDVETMAPSLRVHSGPPPVMSRAHRHDDIEMNLVLTGRLVYLFGGRHLEVCAGQIAIFWGATPHQLIHSLTDPGGETSWAHIPLSTVLSWGLPADHLGALLRTEPILARVEDIGRDVGPLFSSWEEDLASDLPGGIALLEAHAVLRRVLRRHRMDGSLPASGTVAQSASVPAVTEMAQYAASRFREPITAADVAAASHLNPSYAMTLFRDTVGVTLGTYLLRCWIAEAQRLLITTSLTTTEVADAAGFGSQSSFYEQFSKICGGPPASYRRLRRDQLEHGRTRT